jgi:hypothetical protein
VFFGWHLFSSSCPIVGAFRTQPGAAVILSSSDGKRRVCVYQSPEDTFYYDYEYESAEDPRDPGFAHAGRHLFEEKLPIDAAIAKIKENASKWLSAPISAKESYHPPNEPIVRIFLFSSLVIVSSGILLALNFSQSHLPTKQWFWWGTLFVGFIGLVLARSKRMRPNKSFQRTLPSGQRR